MAGFQKIEFGGNVSAGFWLTCISAGLENRVKYIEEIILRRSIIVFVCNRGLSLLEFLEDILPPLLILR